MLHKGERSGAHVAYQWERRESSLYKAELHVDLMIVSVGGMLPMTRSPGGLEGRKEDPTT